MKIYTETNLSSFEFWGPAVDNVSSLTSNELQELEFMLEDVYPDGIDATDLNDLFAYDEDLIATWLGFEDWEDLEDHHQEEIERMKVR